MLVKKLEVNCGKWNLIVANFRKNRKVEKSGWEPPAHDLGISWLCNSKGGSIKVTNNEKDILSNNVPSITVICCGNMGKMEIGKSKEEEKLKFS